MNAPKAYYLDIDGTLTGAHNSSKLNYIDIRSIKAAARDGAHIILTTGRAPDKTLPVFKQINLGTEQTTYVICNNGAVIMNAITEEVIQENPMSKKDFEEIFNLLYGRGYIIKNAENSNYYAKKNWGSKLVKLFTSVEESIDDVKYNKVSGRKIGAIVSISNKKVKKIADEIRVKFPGVEVSISGNSKYLEITKKDINKGTAIKFMSKLIDVDLKDSVHIGDSMNDASAFKVVGTSVALANGMKDLKKLADFTSKSQRKQGVSVAIDSLRQKRRK